MSKPTLTVKGRFLRCIKTINRAAPTLTVRGFVICCASENANVIERKFDWGNALIDAIITSAVTFFSSLGGGAVAGLTNIHLFQSAAIAALSQFFVFMALKRGLVKTDKAHT